MGEAIGQTLPLAVGVALSPVPIIASILMLVTPRARANGPAFVVGLARRPRDRRHASCCSSRGRATQRGRRSRRRG